MLQYDGSAGNTTSHTPPVLISSEIECTEATLPCSGSTVQHSCQLSNEEDVVLDEVTGVLHSRPKTQFASEYTSHHVKPIDEVQLVATWGEDGGIVLDEVTGHFRPSHCDNEDPYSPLQDKNLSFLEEEGRDKAIARVMELLIKQETEINMVREQDEVNQETILQLRSEYDLNGSFGGKFKLKYEAIRRSKARLEAKLKRDNFSPWLSQSQVSRLKRKSSRGLKWTTAEYRDGLILKMRCGTSGYSKFVAKYPLLPSVRQLQKRVQFIRFDDQGILHEIFDLLRSIVGGMSHQERDCQLVFDEMAIQEGERYDNSLKKWIGKSTLPSHTGRATKALVVILAGVTRRWKIPVAVYFTSRRSEEAKQNRDENPTGQAYSNIIDDVLVNADDVGLNVVGVTSDMGPDNLAMWKVKGVQGGRGKTVNPSFSHPVKQDVKIHILPDAVHLQKAVKTMLENNLTVTLPPDVVAEEKLPTDSVNYNHIDSLFEFEGHCELKVAFRLREYNIHCKKQFKKMKVSTGKSVLCHRTGVGLKLLAKELNDPTYETTGWFVILLNTFFTLVCCRHKGLAMSKSNPEVFEKAVSLIKKVEYVFHHMKVGKGSEFKPAQRGMRVLCTSLLSLTNYFLDERMYSYLMLGRFTSDCIESLFSCVRLSQPIPHVTAFLQCLKVITLAQFSEAVKGSSYDYEESSPLPVDFLEEASKRAKERATERFFKSLDELMNNAIPKLTPANYLMLDHWEKSVVYDMGGSVIKAIIVSKQTVCDSCLDSTKWKAEEPHPASTITEMKEFTLLRDDHHCQALQIYISQDVFQALLTAEISFRLHREKTIYFQNADVKAFFVENLMYVWTNTEVRNCHNIGRKILTTFFDGRLKEFGKLRREKANERHPSPSIQKSSKSVAMRQMADQIVVTGAHPSKP